MALWTVGQASIPGIRRSGGRRPVAPWELATPAALAMPRHAGSCLALAALCSRGSAMLDVHAVARPAAGSKGGAADDSLLAAEGRYRARLKALVAGSKHIGLVEEVAVAQGPTQDRQQQQQEEEDEMHRVWSILETSMKTARVEPPWPQVCSQPGASLAKYAALEHELQLLVAGVAVLDSACERESELLRGSEEAAAAMQGALGGALALAAAACARAAEALAHMPAKGPCAGGRSGVGGWARHAVWSPLSGTASLVSDPAAPPIAAAHTHAALCVVQARACHGGLCRPPRGQLGVKTCRLWHTS